MVSPGAVPQYNSGVGVPPPPLPRAPPMVLEVGSGVVPEYSSGEEVQGGSSGLVTQPAVLPAPFVYPELPMVMWKDAIMGLWSLGCVCV